MGVFGSESAFTRRICDGMEAINAYVIPLVGQMLQKPGLPDRYFCHARWRGFVEFKRDRNVPHEAQRLVLKSLYQRGEDCFVVWLLEEDYRERGYARPMVTVNHPLKPHRLLACQDLFDVVHAEDKPTGLAFVGMLEEAQREIDRERREAVAKETA